MEARGTIDPLTISDRCSVIHFLDIESPQGNTIMTTLGWLFMTVSIGSVLSLVSFCISRVLANSSQDDE
jgi:hypothetical protein